MHDMITLRVQQPPALFNMNETIAPIALSYPNVVFSLSSEGPFSEVSNESGPIKMFIDYLGMYNFIPNYVKTSFLYFHAWMLVGSQF